MKKGERVNPWTVQEEKLAVRERGQGKTIAEIARMLKRTPSAVERRLGMINATLVIVERVSGADAKPGTRPDTSILSPEGFRERVLARRRRGLSVLEIAREMGLEDGAGFARVERICADPALRRYGRGELLEYGAVEMRLSGRSKGSGRRYE